MKSPLIHKELFDLETFTSKGHRGNYKAVIGSLKEDDLPIYLVINQDTGVVEFYNENLFFVKDWLAHFVTVAETTEPDAGPFEKVVALGGKKNN